MLPQTARLRKTSDFKEVFGKGKGVRYGRLLLKSATAKNEGVRFGIVVSKQVAAKAVARNHIKRLLREALQDFLPLLKPGHDVVLVTLPGFTLAGLEDAKQKVSGIIKKASLLSPYGRSPEGGKP
jgi:ribonuclease P protein component